VRHEALLASAARDAGVAVVRAADQLVRCRAATRERASAEEMDVLRQGASTARQQAFSHDLRATQRPNDAP